MSSHLASISLMVIEARLQVSECAVIGRKLIWFHHILSTTKRKAIVKWAAELELGGFSKPGYPGVLIVEGMQVSGST